MKPPSQKQREHRARKRAEGYTLKHIWVKAAWWPAIQRYLKRLK